MLQYNVSYKALDIRQHEQWFLRGGKQRKRAWTDLDGTWQTPQVEETGQTLQAKEARVHRAEYWRGESYRENSGDLQIVSPSNEETMWGWGFQRTKLTEGMGYCLLPTSQTGKPHNF